MGRDKEKQKEYNKKYYQEHLEKERLRKKKYRKENPEKHKLSIKNYKENNPEKVHMTYTISKWKKRGLKDNDYESIYYLVMSTEYCDGCGCKLTENKPKTSTSRCMDHDHITGEFRAVLCHSCNSRQPKQPKQIKNNININEII